MVLMTEMSLSAQLMCTDLRLLDINLETGKHLDNSMELETSPSDTPRTGLPLEGGGGASLSAER